MAQQYPQGSAGNQQYNPQYPMNPGMYPQSQGGYPSPGQPPPYQQMPYPNVSGPPSRYPPNPQMYGHPQGQYQSQPYPQPGYPPNTYPPGSYPPQPGVGINLNDQVNQTIVVRENDPSNECLEYCACLACFGYLCLLCGVHD
ncbi:hypothetical protein RF11_12189 [Thelohanellus kitauei]|uniref:Uncharacterized protein n=1 Tax=Thelohanellus kitauei TaxID=669202 RepID=A0A0C2J1K6_THEKT|nr:hypothetical protein RF11_12189 [Thelohanellus kitauei]